jgi:hypothetical protein
MSDEPEFEERPGLFALLGRLPTQLTRLIQDELRAAQAELVGKLRAAGLGAGMVVGGAIVALYALGMLIAAGTLGLALVLDPWLSALIVGLLLMLIAVVLALLGIARLKKGLPPLPTEAIESVKDDISVVTGNRRDSHTEGTAS